MKGRDEHLKYIIGHVQQWTEVRTNLGGLGPSCDFTTDLLCDLKLVYAPC